MIKLEEFKNEEENEEDICFICLDKNDLHDFPCKNCKLKIHLNCLYDYIDSFENNDICSVCKNEITIDPILEDSDSESEELYEYTYYNLLKYRLKKLIKFICFIFSNLIKLLSILTIGNFVGYIFFSSFGLPLYIIRNDENLIIVEILNFILIGIIFGVLSLILMYYLYYINQPRPR